MLIEPELTSFYGNQVTMEIQTNPPKAKGNEQGSPKEARTDLYGGLPASLLE